MKIIHWRAGGSAVITVVLVAGVALSTASAKVQKAKAMKMVIWTDANRAPAVSKVADAWAAKNGVTVKVVSKDFGSIRSTSARSTPRTRLTSSSQRTTGRASSRPTASSSRSTSTGVKKQFPAYTLDAFSYGIAVKKLYGMPTQIENIGLVVNTKLVPKMPTTFAQLESEALAFKKKNHLAYGIAVQQGTGGDAYHMYPFFSGLGGYIFGTNRAGNLDASDIGVANPTFLENAALIDKWNKEGLINSKADESTCKTHFKKSQAAFWITGPWAVANREDRRLVQGHPDAGDREAGGAVPRRKGRDGHEVRRGTSSIRRRRTSS